MKIKKSLSLALVYIGIVIGAGFASGREILEYFNFPHGDRLSGVVFATFLFVMVAHIVLKRATTLKVFTLDAYLSSVTPKFKGLFLFLFIIYMFCGFFVMLAGSGSFFAEAFNMPKIFGILFMAIICFLVFIFDIKGLVLINSFLVPVMIVGILYICITAAVFKEETTFRLLFLQTLRENILFSAACYVSYNTLTVPSVLVPLAKDANKGDIIKGAWIGGIILGVLIMIIQQANNIYFDKLWYSNIPMFSLAKVCGKTAEALYGAVLISAICTTAISQGFGIISYFKIKTIKGRAFASFILIMVAVPFSLIGFGRLIKYIYGFFGILGVFWMSFLILKGKK